jgi:hypothetical protein
MLHVTHSTAGTRRHAGFPQGGRALTLPQQPTPRPVRFHRAEKCRCRVKGSVPSQAGEVLASDEHQSSRGGGRGLGRRSVT